MQNVTVNPVELATHLAATRLDELYQADEITYPYVDSDNDDEPSTYTEEGQKKFDELYDWYYYIVLGNSLESKMDINYYLSTGKNINLNKDTRVKFEHIDFDDEYDYKNTLTDLIGEHNPDDVIRVSTVDYYFNWQYCSHEYKSILKYQDKYILKVEKEDPDLSGNWHDVEYKYITINSPINL